MTNKDKKSDGVETITCPESSNIHSADYEASTGRLVVRFKQNKDDDHAKSAYGYDGVPQKIWDGFKASSSKGAYARTAIVNGGYKSERLWVA